MALGQVMVYIIDYNSYIPMVSIIFNNISKVVPKKKDLNTFARLILSKGALATPLGKKFYYHSNARKQCSTTAKRVHYNNNISDNVWPFYFKYNNMRSVYFKVGYSLSILIAILSTFYQSLFDIQLNKLWWLRVECRQFLCLEKRSKHCVKRVFVCRRSCCF